MIGINREKEKLLSKKEVDELFDYNPNTGDFCWKVSRSNVVKSGTPVKHVSKCGYRQVRLKKHLWMVHRLIWLKVYGEFPDGYIDHINGNRLDNSLINLRVVDKNKNMQNRKSANRDSKSGVLGVCYDKQSGKYRAQLVINFVKVLNKKFNTLDEAKSAYNIAKEKYCDTRN